MTDKYFIDPEENSRHSVICTTKIIWWCFIPKLQHLNYSKSVLIQIRPTTATFILHTHTELCQCTTHTCRMWEQAVKREAKWSTSFSVVLWFSVCLQATLQFTQLVKTCCDDFCYLNKNLSASHTVRFCPPLDQSFSPEHYKPKSSPDIMLLHVLMALSKSLRLGKLDPGPAAKGNPCPEPLGHCYHLNPAEGTKVSSLIICTAFLYKKWRLKKHLQKWMHDLMNTQAEW